MTDEIRGGAAATAESPLIGRAQQFYGSLLTDFDTAVREYVSDAFVLENYLPAEIPFGGRYEGHEGLGRYLGELAAAIEMGPLDLKEWLASGNSVVVRGSESSTVLATGKRYAMDFVHWLEFDEDGRVVSMREYNDTAEMASAFRAD